MRALDDGTSDYTPARADLTLATAQDLRLAGFSVPRAAEFSCYASIGLGNDWPPELVTQMRSLAPRVIVKQARIDGSWWARTATQDGDPAEQELLLARLLVDIGSVLTDLRRRSIVVQCVSLVIVHHQAATLQGHGIGIPADWVQFLAEHNGTVDLDQYIIGVD